MHHGTCVNRRYDELAICVKNKISSRLLRRKIKHAGTSIIQPCNSSKPKYAFLTKTTAEDVKRRDCWHHKSLRFRLKERGDRHSTARDARLQWESCFYTRAVQTTSLTRKFPTGRQISSSGFAVTLFSILSFKSAQGNGIKKASCQLNHPVVEVVMRAAMRRNHREESPGIAAAAASC